MACVLIEVEVKAQVYADLPKILDKIRGIGAKFVKSVEQEDTYFTHPCRNFKNSDEALRLRIEEGKAKLTYKGPRISPISKTRFEVETFVENAQQATLLLEKLGFNRFFTIRKKRHQFRLRDIDIYVDEVYKLGIFIELEKEICEGSFTDVECSLLAIIESLSLPHKIERRSYLELLLEKEMP
ncbi:MAG: class IV adenylate cyclase [Candidatus Methanomethylicota archaeon]|uniref:Class IV adenylate cyclase n=1 Tax=Thermoproteota archaeon TaxID=2056631 RepID=A0A497EYJ6_9CREN|nr:MAG: class IV adenylate cyclase [Candidatus Verstraetearchaeota archaeon]